MRTILILVIVFIFYTCGKSYDGPGSPVFDAGIDIILLDKYGNNLLDTSNPNTYKKEEIKIFYSTNENVSRGFLIRQDAEGIYKMSIFSNVSESEQFPITYIQWNEYDTDTIACQIKHPAIICEKVWYNDSLVWEGLGGGLREITILK